MAKTAYLVLENGKVFTGECFGFEAEAVGELVFQTGVVGYLENLTDANYKGQMVVQTFPLIGNYGFIPEDVVNEKPYLSAYIIKELCQEPSNFRSQGVLDTFLKESKVPCLTGVNTRQLTRILRTEGTQNAKLCLDKPNVDEVVKELKGYKIENAVAQVTCEKAFTVKAENAKYKVAIWDFGVRNGIRQKLVDMGCEVVTVPANATAKEILALDAQGIVLSNGPANPEDNAAIIAEIGEVCKAKKPMLAIGLGHQMLAMSQGASVKKLLHGHHGNQPVTETATKRVYI
ncbi:MAG: carbamoyl phosphate synthase small subunit, partial [Oscillospiraceae bacterium]